MYETFGYKVRLFTTVAALVCRAIHERDVGTDKRGTSPPLRSIRRNFTKEEEHRKALAELILLEVNAGRPIIYTLLGLLSVLWLYGCMRAASSAGEWMDGSRSGWCRCSCSLRNCMRGRRWRRLSSATSRRLGEETYTRTGSLQRRETIPAAAILIVDVISDRRLN